MSNSKSKHVTEHDHQIPVSLIDPNPYQSRRNLFTESLNELVESVKHVGIIQPLVVTQQNGRYVLVAGQRRLEAAKMSGLKAVPCCVKQLEDKDLLAYSLVENLQREDLLPMEEAESLHQLKEMLNLDIRELAACIGKSKSFVGDRLALLTLQDDLKEAVNTGILPTRKALLLKKVTDDARRRELLKLAGTVDLERLEAMVNEPVELKSKGGRPRIKNDLLPGVVDYIRKTDSVKLHGDRISIQFATQHQLFDILTELMTSMSEAENTFVS